MKIDVSDTFSVLNLNSPGRGLETSGSDSLTGCPTDVDTDHSLFCWPISRLVGSCSLVIDIKQEDLLSMTMMSHDAVCFIADCLNSAVISTRSSAHRKSDERSTTSGGQPPITSSLWILLILFLWHSSAVDLIVTLCDEHVNASSGEYCYFTEYFYSNTFTLGLDLERSTSTRKIVT